MTKSPKQHFMKSLTPTVVGQFLGVMAFVREIVSSKQTTLVRAPFFYRVRFSELQNHTHRDFNP
jgi:hypothetical protein